MEKPHLYLKYKISWAQWLTPVIPSTWEAEVSGSQGQTFKTSLANMVKPTSTENTKKTKKNQLARRGGKHL